MPKTSKNLETAFMGESQANRKYLAFSRKAEDEGKTGLAKLFRVTAESETVHALNHLNALGEVKNSAENLKAAISGETYEFEKMYPQFTKEAEEEGREAARISFAGAAKVEKIHEGFFQKALSLIEKGEDVEKKEYFVCQVCGNVETGEAPDTCPVCQSPREKFLKID